MDRVRYSEPLSIIVYTTLESHDALFSISKKHLA